MEGEKILDISWKTILKICVVLICAYAVFSIKDILIWFIFALAISILFNPVIDWLCKKKIPRVFAAIAVYFVFLGFFAVLFALIIPLLITEIYQFIQLFPDYFEKISPPLRELGFQAFGSVEVFLKFLTDNLSRMTGNIFSAISTIFGGVLSFLFIIVSAFFISLEENATEKTLILLFPKKYEAQAISIWNRCQKKVSGWFGVRVLACLFVGVSALITFLIFNVKYAFTLAVIAGFLNFIPYVGPLLTGIILFLVVFPTEAVKSIFVLVSFVLIQEIENNIVSPILTKKIIGLPPVLVLFSLVIGGKIWGFLGALLAIPLFGIIFEFTKEFLEKRKDKKPLV